MKKVCMTELYSKWMSSGDERDLEEWRKALKEYVKTSTKLKKSFKPLGGWMQLHEQVARESEGNSREEQKVRLKTKLEMRICYTCKRLEEAKLRAYCFHGSDSKEWKEALSRQWAHEKECKILSDNNAFRSIEYSSRVDSAEPHFGKDYDRLD